MPRRCSLLTILVLAGAFGTSVFSHTILKLGIEGKIIRKVCLGVAVVFAGGVFRFLISGC
jgi:hypothetical protein